MRFFGVLGNRRRLFGGEDIVDVFFAVGFDGDEPPIFSAVGPVDSWDRLELIVIMIVLSVLGCRKPGEGVTGFPGGE